MISDESTGYKRPPAATQFRKGQSGNPNGRPKSKSDKLRDCAKILNQPVDARTPDGKTVSLDGIEAAYFALCRKGLNGNKECLLEAIRIMLRSDAAIEAGQKDKQTTREELVATFRRMGVNVPDRPN